MRAMEHKTKRERRFERRLAERRERAAVEKKKTILDALYEARGIAERTERGRANAVFEIESVMGDMMSVMKPEEVLRDVARWYMRLDSALAYLEGGKQNEED